jgi:hypothetical protein
LGRPGQPTTPGGPDTPRPSCNPPCDILPRVTADMGDIAGVRAGIWKMAEPRRIRSVTAARYPSGVTASEPYASAVHTESYPRASASVTSRASSATAVPKYPRLRPSFIGARVAVLINAFARRAGQYSERSEQALRAKPGPESVTPDP